MSRWKTQKVKQLAQALLILDNEDDMLLFLRDLLSDKELVDVPKRLEAAKLIDQGYTYREVSKKTGLSTTTVTRVAHSLFGKTGGFDHVLSLLEDE